MDPFITLILVGAAFYAGYHIGFEEAQLKAIKIAIKAKVSDKNQH